MNVDLLNNAYHKELESIANRASSLLKHYGEWREKISDPNVFPDVPEAESIHFRSDLWPIVYEVPLNKRLIFEIKDRFVFCGWEVTRQTINEDSVSIQMHLTGSPWYMDVVIYACGDAQGCKIVKIGEKHEDIVRAEFELVCADGATEETWSPS